MERNLERYYTKFERPLFAPTYYPTEEEFSDPIAYVSKIKSDAENFGIVKIIPPNSFRPPFVIDPLKFEFTPRIQKLNEIDALFRVRIIFINKIVNFWHLQGQQFRLPWIENKYIDLYKLQKLVEEFGGLRKTNTERKWSHIAKQLGFKVNSGSNLKQIYTRWVYPYIKSIEKKDSEDEKNKKIKNVSLTTKKINCCIQNVRRSGRMMAGLRSKNFHLNEKNKLLIDLVFCNKCAEGDNEDLLLLCETCDSSLHTYCLDPPLDSVPKGEWRCPQCVESAVQKVFFEFGFLDSKLKFNLNTFGEWANNFKKSYFNQSPCDVSSEVVEKEFWQNLINIDKEISVKYGADLITSKMGSGFPRKSDNFKGADAKERLFYANHPWNLNNLPVLRESVLSYIKTDISGMMVPWVYVGMCFSTFCWHVEDHWTYSINYNHWGERKIWYGLPGKDAEKFDNLVKKSVPELFVGQPDLLHHMTTALNPHFLIDQGLSIYTIHQNSGEFVITFPRAYHSGYNEGLNFAEAVNFAPPDWLIMGRLCLKNYAKVKRTCVFSHEELIMQMVKDVDKMSINMCLATLDELRYIINQETAFRSYLNEKGLRNLEFCKFEDIPDDERSCQVCRKTLFVSALTCNHSSYHIVCQDHIDQLCTKCLLNKCSLKYRYTLEEFISFSDKLLNRTKAFEEWRIKVNNLYEIKQKNKLKTNISELRKLIEQWKIKRYPHFKEIDFISKEILQFDKTVFAINKFLNRKIRLRDNTRCQKADNRFEYKELKRLCLEFENLNIQDESLEIEIANLFLKIEKWKKKVANVLITTKNQNIDDLIIKNLLEIINEGEEFNLKFPEMEIIQKELSRCQWLIKANKIVECYNFCQKNFNKINFLNKNEFLLTQQQSLNNTCIKFKTNLTSFDLKKKSCEFEKNATTYHRFNLSLLNKLIKESNKFLNESLFLIEDTVKNLIDIQIEGMQNEEKAKQFLLNNSGIGYLEANKFWSSEFNNSNWLNEPNYNKFCYELELAQEINTTFTKINNCEDKTFSLKIIKNLENQCQRSYFEKNGQIHNNIKILCEKLQKFVDKIYNMFQKTVGYYNIFEIISGRDDLTALVEGDSVPRTLFTSTRYNDNWMQLKHFNTKTLLLTHLTAIAKQQLNLLMALRLVNQTRSLKETCCCGKDFLKKNKDYEENQDFILCFLCNATFHDVCAQWEPFMERLPPGVFLCPRCLRSRRPCIHDVEAACELAPKNSLERLLVENLLNRSIIAFQNLQKAMHNMSKICDLNLINLEQVKTLQEALIMVLSLEVTDVETYKMFFSSDYFPHIFSIDNKKIQVWRKIQSKMIESKPRPVIFSSFLNVSSKNLENNLLRKNNKRHSAGHLIYVTSNSLSNKSNSENSGLLKSEIDIKKINYQANNDLEINCKKRCRELIYENFDKDFCAADKCLRPYSEQVRWIQCESGCMRWYHYVCVGQTIKAAQKISTYTCYKCLSNVTTF